MPTMNNIIPKMATFFWWTWIFNVTKYQPRCLKSCLPANAESHNNIYLRACADRREYVRFSKSHRLKKPEHIGHYLNGLLMREGIWACSNVSAFRLLFACQSWFYYLKTVQQRSIIWSQDNNWLSFMIISENIWFNLTSSAETAA